MAKLGLINYVLTLCCLAGLGLSIYAYVVELQAEKDKNYKAMCDIGEHMSCTKAFTSKYGKGFGFLGKIFGEDSVFNKPNSLAGILVYSLLATLAQSNSLFITRFSMVLIIVSNLLSVYFAYILYFILHDFCIVCVSTYVVNFLNLLLTCKKISTIKNADKQRKEKVKNVSKKRD